MSEQRYGATLEEWQQLSLVVGLTADLLPVVSNPTAVISPQSKMKGLGKTPSRYNRSGQVAGIADWTQYQATTDDVHAWAQQPDYGICIQTRTVRALDIDIDSIDAACAVWVAIGDAVGYMPHRRRSNSGKCLVAFTLDGEFTKRSFKTKSGIVEFLADGQQFVAIGMHPSGVRYEWPNGLPDEFPTITAEQFEALWSSLVSTFATEAPSELKKSTKAATLAAAASKDPVARLLFERGLVLSPGRDGALNVICPFASEHTADTAESATTYFPARTNGYERGHWHCLHAHCAGRTDAEFNAAIGYTEGLADFSVVEQPQHVDLFTAAPDAGTESRFVFTHARDFRQGKAPAWIVKGVLFEAGLAVVYGDSGTGKSFFMLDMLAAIAGGADWRDRRTKQMRCAYIVAEGAQGFRSRLSAYAQERGTDPDIFVLADAPDLLKVEDVRTLIAQVNAIGPVGVIVVDTLARTMGGDENSGEDMGRAVAHCGQLHKHTGALVVLVHHSGKDAAKGARGHSSLRAAADIEIELIRAEHDHVATVKKLKDRGREGEEFGFKLGTVTLGQDDEGEVITSCVIEHQAAAPQAQRRRPIKGDNEKIVMRVLDALVDLAGNGPDLESLKVAAVAQMVEPEQGTRDRRRDLVVKAVNGLLAGGHVEQVEGRLQRVGG